MRIAFDATAILGPMSKTVESETMYLASFCT